MSFGITKAIPAERGIELVDALYDGTLKEHEFQGERLEEPMPRRGHQGTRYFSGDEWPQR